jgi:hypothetical protein
MRKPLRNCVLHWFFHSQQYKKKLHNVFFAEFACVRARVSSCMELMDEGLCAGRMQCKGWLLLAAIVAWCVPAQGELKGAHVARESVADEVYFQEVGRQVATDQPLTSIAVFQGSVFAGSARGLSRLDREMFQPVESVTLPINRLVTAGGNLWALAKGGFYRLDGLNGDWKRISGETVSDVCAFRSEILATVGSKICRVRGEKLEEFSSHIARFGINRITPHNETLFVHGPGRVTTHSATGFGGLDAYTWPSDQVWDWGALPSPNTRDILSQGASLFIATDRGLGVLRGMSLMTLRGEQGLPFEDTTCLASGFTNDLWIGTTRGAIRKVDGESQYFAGRRWLPDDRVHAIACDARAVYFATDRGLGIIEYEPYTLAKKAEYYEWHLEAWGQKRLGFTHKLEWDEGLKEFVREVSDNDGGYTGNYLAALAYRYAVTKDPAARRDATNTFHALRWLEAMTGIPGFPARSVWAKDERGHKAGHGSGGYAAEWHDTADGKFEWKGDTSSDEICSQFYAVALFLELVAQGPEIDQAKSLLARIATHLIENKWRLIDKDGKPTRWGRWDPEYFLTDEGRYDRDLQAVQLLSFVKTAEEVTGNPKFTRAYADLVRLGYPGYTLRARNTFPPENILHFLDELAFWSFWNLLRYEKDPDLYALYRRGYERSYEAVRVEENPWFNFLYGALTGNDCEVAASAEHLRSWPLDLRVWSYQNSHRTDLRTPAGYTAPKGGTRTFPPRETEPLRWDRWLMQVDGGANGQEVVEPGAWLLAYWMGRYHQFIDAPTTTDPDLLKVKSAGGSRLGAKPYEGPARPF